MRPWIGTSWKMNGTHAETLHYAQEILSSGITDHCDEHLFIIPPFPYIADLVRYFKQTNIIVGIFAGGINITCKCIDNNQCRFIFHRINGIGQYFCLCFITKIS